MAFEFAIALTGGIASGKSTVASLLALNGLRVIDADAIAHTLLDLHVSDIESMFGSKYIKKSKVNRAELGSLVFSDKDKKVQLEAFLHPKIRKEIEKQSEKQDGFKFPYLIDIPLFFETNAYDIKNSVVVYTPKDIQLERFMKRNGFDEEESLRRIESQMPIDEKKKLATFVIDNAKNLKHLQQECENFVDGIKKAFNYGA